MQRLSSSGVVVVILLLASVSLAQDEPKPDELKKMYEDALVQLKAAQDRKNELGNENEKLKNRIAELEKTAAEKQAQMDALQEQVAGYAEKTFFLRSHYAAWREFLLQHPQLLTRWKVFLESNVLDPQNELPPLIDNDWPLSAKG